MYKKNVLGLGQRANMLRWLAQNVGAQLNLGAIHALREVHAKCAEGLMPGSTPSAPLTISQALSSTHSFACLFSWALIGLAIVLSHGRRSELDVSKVSKESWPWTYSYKEGCDLDRRHAGCGWVWGE